MMLRHAARSAAAVVLVGLPVIVTPTPVSAAGRVFVFDGRGHGHGVGLAQDSAQAMAAAGADAERILGHFYPGTGRARRSGDVRVLVWEAGSSTGQVTLSVPDGARLTSGSRSSQARPGAVLRVTADGSGYHVREEPPAVARGAAMRQAFVDPTPTGGPLPGLLPSFGPSPSPSRTASPTPAPRRSPSAAPTPRVTTGATSGPSAAATAGGSALSFDSTAPVTVTPLNGGVTSVTATGRRYRGDVVALAQQGFRLVNVLDVEDYLRGMGEVPASWPAAALRAQAVAARTYALRASAAGHPLGYDLCDDARCQVYLGASAEAPSTTAAARDTRGEVITYGSDLADAFYSANAGGVTATPAEGFGGSSSVPYLPGGVAAPGGVDPWKLSVSPADVARRLDYGGRLDRITISSRGPSGRATAVRLEGAAGKRELTGVEVARRLGLRSTLFNVTLSTGTAQALPPAMEATQLPPTQAADVPVQPAPLVAPGDLVALDRAPAVAATDTAAPPAWTETGLALLAILASFAAVLGRRAHLHRVRSAAHRTP